MKKIIILLISVIISSCGKQTGLIHNFDNISIVTTESATEFANSITESELQELLSRIASKEFEGRKVGSHGQKLAANFLKNYYVYDGIKTPFGGEDYFQTIPSEHLEQTLEPSENVIAYIEGSTFPNEYVIISAHYDHLGKIGDAIFYGADDNGSGTAAVLEIAEAFKIASSKGYTPKRSVVFIHMTGEEKGLLGSKYYSNFPVFPLSNTIANLNIDMIGRVDKAHLTNPNYVYIIGSDKLSNELHLLSEKINDRFTNLELDYTFNAEDDPNQFYYRSDHYNFAKNNIPVIFYFNGTHEDYHKPSDTADKIEYEILAKRSQLIFYTAWELANREQKIKLN